MPIELTPSPPVMHLARWIESLVQQGANLAEITAGVEIVVDQICPSPPPQRQTIGRLLREHDREHDQQ